MITIVLFRRLDLQKDYAFEILTKHFQTVSLGLVFGFEGRNYCVRSHFVLPVRNNNTIGSILLIQRIAEDAYVWMDRFTIRNLELYHIIQMQSRYLM
jgi:DNA mismatch repair protein MutS